MKEFVCYIIPVMIVFCLIGIIETVMLFENKENTYDFNQLMTMKGRDLWKF